MTDPHHHDETNIHDEGALVETPEPPRDETPGAPEGLAPQDAASGDMEREGRERIQEQEPTQTAPAEHEEETPAEPHGGPVPVQQLAERVDALERRAEETEEKTRFLGRIHSLLKRVEESGDPEAPALAARLRRLEMLCQEQLEENFRSKEALTVRAEELSGSTDWKTTADAIKALQAEWKTIGPMPQEKSQELWQRFRKAGNTFFERRQEHLREVSQEQEENLRRKEELVVRAEALADSTDWKPTAEAFKALQAEWKTIGPAPRDKADDVWRRFRKAADTFFDRRQEHSGKLRQGQEENLRRKEELCVRAEELSQSTQWKATVQAIKELQAEWRAIGPVPNAQADAIWRRFRAAIDLFFERQAAYFAQRNQDQDRRQEDRKDQMLDALERKREQADRLKESILRDEENLRRWQGTLANLQPGASAEEMRVSLEGKISDVESKLAPKRTRLDELEASIREIASRL